MSEILDRYGRIADAFGDRLRGVSQGQWEAATPCTDWNVGDLVAHVVTTQRRVLAAATGGEAEEANKSAELGPQWDEANAAVRRALADPDTASTVVSGMFGEQPFESLVSRLLCADTLLHTWDLARATGQDEQLDPGAVDAAIAFLTPIDDAIRRPGGFAPKIEPPSGADAQTSLLCFCGRPT